jgi:hypothetical protein
MVYRWRGRKTDFTVWSASRDATVEEVKSYIAKRNRDKLVESGVRLQWSCPYCDTASQSHDKTKGFEDFKNHLFTHKKPLLESGVHVADDINGTGSVAVMSKVQGQGADNIRVHFHSPGDIVIIVTTNPADRIRLLQEQLNEWPEWTVIMTTKSDPLSGLSGIELMDVPVEVVELAKQMGLGSLTETISRVIQEQEHKGGKITFEFDVLTELITKGKLQRIFKFLHLLTGRLEKANVLSHFFVDRERMTSSMNVLDPTFDMRIRAEDKVFIKE